MCDGADFFLCLLSILFPPIGVWVKRGICSADSFINIGLCILGYLPGLIHAWYIISSYPDASYSSIPSNDDEEEGHYAVVYVRGRPPRGQQQRGGGGGRGGQSYGTIAAEHRLPEGQQPAIEGQAKPSAGNSRQQQQQSSGGSGEGSSDGLPPPSYADVVKGDNKVQTDD